MVSVGLRAYLTFLRTAIVDLGQLTEATMNKEKSKRNKEQGKI